MYLKRIKDLREDSDYKQYEIAEYLGCNRKTYYLYENGKRDISCTRLILLAKKYNVSCDYMVGRSNHKGYFAGRPCLTHMRLKSLRRNHHYNEEYIADKLKCSQENYSQYETGNREMPLDMIIKLADLYDVSVDYILLGVGKIILS